MDTKKNSLKLRIEEKWIKQWEKKQKCNDCDSMSVKLVKFPKFSPISVCKKCYDNYYVDQIKKAETYR